MEKIERTKRWITLVLYLTVIINKATAKGLHYDLNCNRNNMT
jgi:hypothetical protein